ncbi:epimerase [Aeromonas hydrophila]|uniref:NAD-dependent epimerase/dehydratase family protein n=1 Tax=Aeromonas hydrophila TaxID=644 RepID=UPI0011162F5F|nr:NAD(P)-dependent oxidoreductase [Aeromonas hydrophila]TNH77691.1 epimerase [Aeromonas hydrophila]
MKIAVLGATSFIAQELIREWVTCQAKHEVHLYARDLSKVAEFIGKLDTSFVNLGNFKLDSFPNESCYDVVINFIGAGDPAKTKEMSGKIMDVTFRYDDMVLCYLEQHQQCKYIFLSSGAAYGGDFAGPASLDKKASFNINKIQDSEKYGLAKFLTEMKHRCKPELSIIDLRVFNFFSRNQDLTARFFITDLLKSIQNSTVCNVSPSPMVRDYLHPRDFCQIINCLIYAEKCNISVDCYSLSPVDKTTLLLTLEHAYGLRWCYSSDASIMEATGKKSNYYSENKFLSTLGYKPNFSSLDTILTEFEYILSKNKNNNALL